MLDYVLETQTKMFQCGVFLFTLSGNNEHVLGALPYNRTLAYNDPQCSRSLKLSALVFRTRLSRPHSWFPLPHTPSLLHSLSFCFCLSRPASITLVLPTFQTKSYVYRTVPSACWPCWLHYLQSIFNLLNKFNNGERKSVFAFQYSHNTETGNHKSMVKRHL